MLEPQLLRGTQVQFRTDAGLDGSTRSQARLLEDEAACGMGRRIHIESRGAPRALRCSRALPSLDGLVGSGGASSAGRRGHLVS